MIKTDIEEVIESLTVINKSHTELAENFIKAKAKLARIEDWAKQNLNASSGLFAILEKK